MPRLGSTAARLKLKGIDGEAHKRWTMRFNSTTSEEPYLGLKVTRTRQKRRRARSGTCDTGAAWSSSARVVKRSLQWGNERNPCRALYVSRGTAVVKTEEGGDDVRSAWPSDAQGDTRGTMAGTKGREAARRSKSHQSRPQCGSQSATRLREVGIASNRGSERHGEYVLAFCTHRPSSQKRGRHLKSAPRAAHGGAPD